MREGSYSRFRTKAKKVISNSYIRKNKQDATQVMLSLGYLVVLGWDSSFDIGKSFIVLSF